MMKNLRDRLRAKTNEAIAKKKAETAKKNAKEAAKQAELAAIPESIRDIVPSILTMLNDTANGRERTQVVRYLGAEDFPRGTDLKKISKNTKLRGEAKALRKYFDRQELECSIRQVAQRQTSGGIGFLGIPITVCAELIVKW